MAVKNSYIIKFIENSLTSSFRFSKALLLSLSIIPLSINSTIFLMSFSFTHLVVIAGVPILTHEGRNGGRVSFGIRDLETEMPILSNAFSTSAQL
jgi:hypothetical protein